MKKILMGLSIGAALLIGCQKNDNDIDIGIRVKNTSDVLYNEFILAGYAPELKYANIAPGSTTEYQMLGSDMRPDVFILHIGQDTLGVVYDYVPEYYDMDNGFYTIEVDNTLSAVTYVKE